MDRELAIRARGGDLAFPDAAGPVDRRIMPED